MNEVCSECGMPCQPGEYHPFAACLMFKACHNSETVRANLEAVRQSAASGAEPVAWLDAADLETLANDGWCVVHAARCDPGADHNANMALYASPVARQPLYRDIIIKGDLYRVTFLPDDGVEVVVVSAPAPQAGKE